MNESGSMGFKRNDTAYWLDQHEPVDDMGCSALGLVDNDEPVQMRGCAIE